MSYKLADVDLCRWQLSKTTKEDADDDIAKYDGLLLFCKKYPNLKKMHFSHVNNNGSLLDELLHLIITVTNRAATAS